MTTVGEPIEPEVWRWYYEKRRQGRGRHRRHLVADRDRRLPRLHAARHRPDEAGLLRPGGARHLPRHPRRGRQRGARRAAARRATSSSATRGRASSRRSGASRSGSSRPTTPSTTRTRRVQGLARLALLRRRRRHPGGRRLLPDPRPGRRRDQRGRPPARHQGARVGRAHGERGRGGRRGPGHRRHPRPRGRDVHLAQARVRRRARRSRPRSGTRSRPTSARSPGRRTSGSSPTCRRPGPARSCAASSPRPRTSPTPATSPRSPTPRSWRRSAQQVQSAKLAKGEVPRELRETELTRDQVLRQRVNPVKADQWRATRCTVARHPRRPAGRAHYVGYKRPSPGAFCIPRHGCRRRWPRCQVPGRAFGRRPP